MNLKTRPGPDRKGTLSPAQNMKMNTSLVGPRHARQAAAAAAVYSQTYFYHQFPFILNTCHPRAAHI